MSRTHLLFAVAALVSCSGGPEEYIDPGPAFEQIRSVVRDFAIANEFYYAEESEFTDDVVRLQRDFEWPNADSVDLQVVLDANRDGWGVVGTHVRLGPAVGCVLAWGRRPPIETPSGVPHDGSNEIVCDSVADRNSDD